MRFTVTLNGTKIVRDPVRPDDLLIDFLHEEGLTGTKYSCGIGMCGSCKVAIQAGEGEPKIPVLACFARLNAVDGMRVTTVEGLAGPGGGLHPLQEEFLESHAFQCGYSTPGMLMAGDILMDRLERAPIPADRLDREILSAISGHVCRCTGYVRYFEGIKKVIRERGLVDPSPSSSSSQSPAPSAEPPPSVWFRVTKRSRYDVKTKVLEGFFESPAATLSFARPMAWDACEGEVVVKVDNIRTGEPARDLNLRRFLFHPIRELTFQLESARVDGVHLVADQELPPGATVPLEVEGWLVAGEARVKVATRAAVTGLGGRALRVCTRAPIRVPLESLGLPVTEFAAEFGLKLGAEVEFGIDHLTVEAGGL